ncbi:hypothetical protein OAJ75_02025 [Candidatus Pelagibacter sp.]|nr:hypothetical protein [Candidatus Pelagibacter sp.]
MILGVDFDNTLINYDKVFSEIAKKNNLINKTLKSKELVKKKVIFKHGEDEWTRLQGQVYGKEILKAHRNKFIKESLDKINKIAKIYLISHKTKFPIIGKKINMHNSALVWLKKNNLYGKNKVFNKENIFFERTLQDKVNKIKLLKCDIYIDDLTSVLDRLDFEIIKILFNKKKIGYNSINNWKKIKNFIYKIQNNKKKILKSGRNNKITRYQVNNKLFIKKQFSGKKINNLKEGFFCDSISDYNFVPQKIFSNYEENFSIYNFIKGKKIKKIKLNHIDQCIKFLIRIQYKKKDFKIRLKKKSFYAEEKCLSLSDHINSVVKKKNRLQKSIKNSKNIKLNNFFFKKLNLKYLEIIKSIKKSYSKNDLDRKVQSNKLILSPSDFGFHNILENNNKLFFFDFEYCGIDDSRKLICDFICQPDIYLNDKIKNYFLNSISKNKIFNFKKKDIFFLIKLYRIKWCLIILNDFVINVKKRRIFSGNYSRKKLSLQISKSIAYYNKFLNT